MNFTDIVLNGPSLLKFEHFLTDSNVANRIVFSYAALTKIQYNWSFWEPASLDTWNPLFKNENDELNRALNSIKNIWRYEVIDLINNAKDLNIICSPFRNLDNPYHLPLPENNKIYKTNYFFVDESSTLSILESLKTYFQKYYSSELILNFNCSLIRAVSIALKINSSPIRLYGLDPSINQHFYGFPGTLDSIFSPKKALLAKLFEKYYALTSDVAHKYTFHHRHGNKPFKSQPECLALYLSFVKKVCSNDYKRIYIYSSDELLYSHFKTYKVEDRIKGII
ncbi:hypothetical protein [Synechococcus sp. N26]|uniref:hypothetical protein n=1 Tax=Synechococcus sp. N26 TaxID=2575513 RepID=UPI0010BD85A3|nr:hypothetical protein [Synechococcus sp. N26]